MQTIQSCFFFALIANGAAMKRTILLFLIIFLSKIALAGDFNLVKIDLPADKELLNSAEFQLFHRTGEYWLGTIPENSELSSSFTHLGKVNPSEGEIYLISCADSEELRKIISGARALYQGTGEVIIQATEIQLRSMSSVKTEWIRISTSAKPLDYSGVSIPETDQFHPLVNDFVSQVSGDQYLEYMEALEGFVTRNTYSNGAAQAANWILDQFESMGLEAYADPFQISGQTKFNVVAELTGQVHPDSVVFVTGHYDATAGSPWTTEPIAPGADDNASGVACVLECARIMSQYQFEYTVRFVAFSGEEQGLYGSEDFVDDLLISGTSVIGSFNYDMIAYSGDDPWPPDLVIYTDNNPLSQAMADKVAEAVLTFVPNEVEPDVDINPSMSSSDHGPFWDAGLPAICGIEEQAWGPDFNPWYHSVDDVIANCDLEYAVNCSKAALAAVADYAGPIVENGPALMIGSFEVEELIGNGNGIPDPGEVAGINVTLTNVGVAEADSISAYLVSYDPYVAMNQPFSGYPDLLPGQNGTCNEQYEAIISPDCPAGRYVTLTLDISAAGGYQTSSTLSFQVSDPQYSPSGPDAYGYYAFDMLDESGPVYDWIEIDPAAGGSGTVIRYTQDDETVVVDLPFDFQYYGSQYSEISVCNNGWISMGETNSVDYSNSHIPNADGPPAMIAPFWEDLSPQIAGSVSYYYDAVEHYFVVEYNQVRQYFPITEFETFEVILFDPVHHPTLTGDGKILFQYNDLMDPSSCTIGIENPGETTGIEYLYNGDYHVNAAPIGDQTAILIMTVYGYPDIDVTLIPAVSPIQIPSSGGEFDFNIAAVNNELISQTFDIWCDIILPNGNVYGPVLGPAAITLGSSISIDRDRTQAVPQNAPEGNYTYNAYIGIHPDSEWSSDHFDFEKLADGFDSIVSEWGNWGESFDSGDDLAAIEIPLNFELSNPYPNPFNNQSAIEYSIPAAGLVSLTVYDVQGREVRKLAGGFLQAGVHRAEFDARGLASGVYFVTLDAQGFKQSKKLLMIK